MRASKWDMKEWKSLVRRLSSLSQQQIEWGFFGNIRYPDDYPERETRGLPVSLVATINEYGSGKTPSRPFMRINAEGLEQDREAVERHAVPILHNIIKRMPYRGKMYDYSVYLAQALKRDIDDYPMTATAPFPSNAPMWAKIKGKNKPLDYTRFMMNSIEKRVVSKGTGEEV